MVRYSGGAYSIFILDKGSKTNTSSHIEKNLHQGWGFNELEESLKIELI